MMNLPIIDDCTGCGACCLEQSSPPGYVGFLSGALDPETWPDAEDAERYRTMPEPARRILEAYLAELRTGEIRGERPCCWFDRLMRRCMFHEHRPQICRDLPVGGDSCLGWRERFDIGVGREVAR